ncbi:MAG: hypothetical protein COZ69_02500 [Deltaproteobacteria bacterium CG_4_8_14_3_um_filter_45_9]|nr:MAG: hypothetical protein COS40_01960 [Deltaproteobacteria bacterium CG03_land_8_20_14_0_80_45_14]PIX25688.1 MAG: hypothetical protein COZ69_02500 [Deltaproteobacteria bacterium CG_4_8_14_3_um_filter_45_9]
MDSKDRITLGEGRGNAFIEFLKEGRKGDCTERAGNSRKDPGTSKETISEGQAGVVKATG